MTRTGAGTSPEEDAAALAGSDLESLEILNYILASQARKGLEPRAHLTLMMLEKIKCYDSQIAQMYHDCDEVFEDMYFKLGQLAGIPSFMLYDKDLGH